jgi:predicted adenine nucleotide alpha hydrolase (AANH) superfamily ATPase
MKKLLLHCCCAPCANQPINLLMVDYSLELYYGNSNIQPEKEYQLRRDCLRSYGQQLQLTVHEAQYNRGEWYQAIGNDGGAFPLVDDESHPEMIERRRQRCRLCYRYRFRGLAETAEKQKIEMIASTLAISPYQFQDILEEELQAAAASHQLQSLFIDWRPYYTQGQELARRLGFYRQKYCGCEFSRQEAIIERAQRSAKQRSTTANPQV